MVRPETHTTYAMVPPARGKRSGSLEKVDPRPSLSETCMAILRALGFDNEPRHLTSESEQRVLSAAAASLGLESFPPRPSGAVRQARIARARRLGGRVNPTYDVQGHGEWRWLDATYDRHIAFNRHQITTPRDTVEFRRIGAIAIGEGPNADPMVVFYPDQQYLDPLVQPDGPGHFAFLTPEDENWAQLQLGGSEAHGLSDRPSATDKSLWKRIRAEIDQFGEL